MKSFLSTRAGASFFYGSNHTVVYHKDTIEYILRFDSPNGKTWGYAHLYILFGEEDTVVLFINWQEYLKHLSQITDKAHFFKMMERPCPNFTSGYLNKRNDGIVRIELPKEDVEGFAIILKDKEYETIDPMTLPFRKEVEEKALQLLDFSLDVYKELLLHAPLKNWKDRVAELWN